MQYAAQQTTQLVLLIHYDLEHCRAFADMDTKRSICLNLITLNLHSKKLKAKLQDLFGLEESKNIERNLENAWTPSRTHTHSARHHRVPTTLPEAEEAMSAACKRRQDERNSRRRLAAGRNVTNPQEKRQKNTRLKIFSLAQQTWLPRPRLLGRSHLWQDTKQADVARDAEERGPIHGLREEMSAVPWCTVRL